MAGRDDWMSVARSSDEDLKERILTGFKSGKPFTPYVPTIDLPAPLESVLDFGCGVGRNFPYLKTIARRVEGFDLPPMIDRCRALATEPVDRLASDWTDVRTRRYGLIFSSLVLQHIETDACREYVVDFAGMAPAVYLLTRARTDFGAHVMDLVADCGLYDAGPCVVVDHDPATHQLRTHGSVPFEAARRARAEDVHYEVLLRSRAFEE
ncbi:MAG TPA: class I SAM-dependent methyltransferase [Vicinamibacterales bacterium]|nr:class I SAM-dependent methyltransferase [Vicinamibacterales bacterium]